MPRLRYYITGHGLGHASRSCQILQAMAARHPAVRCEVVSGAAPWFLRDNLPPGIPVVARTLDVGVVQKDSLEMDLPATVAACRAMQDDPGLFARECDDLHRGGIDLVVTDVAALPCGAAATAGIPAVIISNFTWDWIYEGFCDAHPEFAAIVAWQRNCYRQAHMALRLPFHGPLPVARVIDLPLVARRSRQPRETVRQRLGIPEDKRLALFSFGGFGLEGGSFEELGQVTGWIWLAEPELAAKNPCLRPLPAGFAYPDLVNAADAVITKPGYGIVAECIAHHTPVLYTPRGDFREQALLVAGLQRHVPAVEIDNRQLRRGALQIPLERLLRQSRPAEVLAVNGAEVAADHLASLLA